MTGLAEIRERLRAAITAPEDVLVARLAEEAALDGEARRLVHLDAADLVRQVRVGGQATLMESFLAEYGLSTREGVALMCLAEALLRVPDPETIDDLIADKIAPGAWGQHLGRSASSLVNASTWALMLTGRVVEDETGTDTPTLAKVLREAVRRLGEPVIRAAVAAAMREMGEHFVLGTSMLAARSRARAREAQGYTYSYDMLGEAARTEADAARYLQAYRDAIREAGSGARGHDVRDNPGVSVKLSALHPRYEQAQRARVLAELAPRLAELARMAAAARIGLNIDAEEADRLDLSLDVIEAVLPDPALAGWDGFGVVVQAYGRRAPDVIDWLHALAARHDRRIMIRLVKGAYWDSEIKRAQTLGLAGYPVFTRKAHTDISYLGCARRLLAARERIYPQFATHNAHSVAAILHMAGPERRGFEFQRLHGMGERLHALVMERERTRCRIYAPVGEHRDLLAYLVRRLLENGANSSFVHRIVNASVPPEAVAADPFAVVAEGGGRPNPVIPSPADLFAPARLNAIGFDLADPAAFATLAAAVRRFDAARWLAGVEGAGEAVAIRNPADPDDTVGTLVQAGPREVEAAHARARAAFPAWSGMGADARATRLEAAAGAYEAHAPELITLLRREAGKTWPDAVADLREAVDFLRYYAAEARRLASTTGRQAGRGVFACISPWNFPLAIFTGQVAAALAAGNTVLAKPAEQTPLIAARAVALLHKAGIPADALHCLPGDGPTTGAALTTLPGLDGVCFTGSTDTARRIALAMADSAAPDAPLIAETGGLNAMIVDSTALPEQAVRDILASAFQSAGQRCSALRILYVQDEVAEPILAMLTGAMDTLTLGDPRDLASDIGPVIDAEAKAAIDAHIAQAQAEGRLIKHLPAPATGHFCGPALIRVNGIAELEREVFGPVLHVATFRAEALDGVVAAINASGYGLTLGLHSRVDRRVQRVVERARVGNIYVNRNQIGAVVGCQPFGGEGLSGTGPKAGGPAYLPRFLAPAQDWPTLTGAVSPDPVAPRAVSPTDLAQALAAAALALPGWQARADRAARLREALATLPKGLASPARTVLDAIGDPTPTAPRDLPGPTGESNRLIHAPRGVVLCLGRIDDAGRGHGGDDGAVALAQAVGALALGNCAVILAPGAGWLDHALASAGLALGVLDGGLDPGVLADLAGIDALAAWGPPGGIAALRRALATRPGPILPLLTEPVAPDRLLLERCISIDTTAAGGNAALLAAAE